MLKDLRSRPTERGRPIQAANVPDASEGQRNRNWTQTNRSSVKRRIAVYYMQVTPAASRVEMHFSWLSHPPRAYGDVNLALSVSTQRRHAASYLAGRAVARRRRGILETRVVYEVK